jgi:hypothetical protein
MKNCAFESGHGYMLLCRDNDKMIENSDNNSDR